MYLYWSYLNSQAFLYVTSLFPYTARFSVNTVKTMYITIFVTILDFLYISLSCMLYLCVFLTVSTYIYVLQMFFLPSPHLSLAALLVDPNYQKGGGGGGRGSAAFMKFLAPASLNLALKFYLPSVPNLMEDYTIV